MAALEILQHIGQVVGCHLCIQREDPLDDVVRACLVGRLEVARLGRRPERPHDHARGIGPQMESLPVQERDLRQSVLGSFGVEFRESSSTQDMERGTSGTVAARKRELTDFRETEQIG